MTTTTTTTARPPNRRRATTGGKSAPTTPGGTRANAADYFTLGAGIASGHYHAYLPDPWTPRAASPGVSGSGSGSENGNKSGSEKKDGPDGPAAGLMSGAARFGRDTKSRRAQTAAAAAAVAAAAKAGSPSSASAASSVSAVGSVAAALEPVDPSTLLSESSDHDQQQQQQQQQRPAAVRLVRAKTYGGTYASHRSGAGGVSGSSAASPSASAYEEARERPASVYSTASDGGSSLSSSSSSTLSSRPMPAGGAAADTASVAGSDAPTVDHTPPRVTFPEGGLQAWLVVAGSFCAMVSVFGVINTAAVFESWFATHQLAAYTASEIGWIFSLYLFFVFFVGIQVGPLFDRYGPRWLVALGSVLVVASVLLLGLCTQYYQILLCYSVLGGLGGALLNTPAYACIAHFFNARRGLATGIATTSGGVGGIAFPMLLQQLLPRLGFAWSTRILGFILLALSVPANLWLRTRLPLPGVNSGVDDEEEGGGGAPSVRTARSRRLPSVWPDFSIFRDRCYAVAAAGIFFMEWGIFVPLTFIVSYASAHHQDTNHAYTLLALLNAGSVLGRFLPGLLADRFGRFNVIIVTIALSSAVVLGVWLPAGNSAAVLAAFAVLFGFASGSNLGLIAVCLGQLCEPSQYGRYFSTAMMVASFGTLSSVPIGGAILGDGLSEAGWKGLIAFSGVSYAVALACYVTARVMAVGWSPRVRF